MPVLRLRACGAEPVLSEVEALRMTLVPFIVFLCSCSKLWLSRRLWKPQHNAVILSGATRSERSERSEAKSKDALQGRALATARFDRVGDTGSRRFRIADAITQLIDADVFFDVEHVGRHLRAVLVVGTGEVAVGR